MPNLQSLRRHKVIPTLALSPDKSEEVHLAIWCVTSPAEWRHGTGRSITSCGVTTSQPPTTCVNCCKIDVALARTLPEDAPAPAMAWTLERLNLRQRPGAVVLFCSAGCSELVVWCTSTGNGWWHARSSRVFDVC